MRKAITSISFLSISIAYTAGLMFFAVQQVLENGKVEDFGPIIFWSGLFELLAWLTFIRIPLIKIRKDSLILKKWVFPVVSALYAEIVFIILIGWLFLQSDYYIIFGIAAVVGLVFGLTYITLINHNQVVRFFNEGLLKRLTALLYPVGFLLLFLWGLPNIAPATAFRFMPDEIRHQIIEQTMLNYKVGDEFESLKNSLPGYFDHIENGSGNMAAQLGNFSFVVQVHCDKIVRLEHSKQEKPDLSIYGKIHEKPCP